MSASLISSLDTLSLIVLLNPPNGLELARTVVVDFHRASGGDFRQMHELGDRFWDQKYEGPLARAIEEAIGLTARNAAIIDSDKPDESS